MSDFLNVKLFPEGTFTMLTLEEFVEWLKTFKFAGTARWQNVTIQITSADREKCLRACLANPVAIRGWLKDWRCEDPREALALYTHMTSDYFGYQVRY